MKKTLIALAALASIGSAFAADAPAGPTITPYARIDIGVQSLTSDAAAAVNKGVLAGDSIYNTSIWGIKGETDLGGGMKGFAQVENSFKADSADGLTGAGNARVGKIGISGNFGVLELGAMWGPYDNSTVGDAQDYNGFSAYGRVLNTGAHGDNGNGTLASGNTAGSINYTTPTISGFNAAVNYAPAKDALNQDISSYGLDVTYNNGPVSFAAAYDSTPTIYSNVGAPALTTGKTNAWLINGGYNLGAVTVYAALIGATANGTTLGSDKDTGYALSVKYPVGQWTLSGGFGSVKTSGDDWNQHTDAIGVQALYALNKQFTAYVGYKNWKTTPDVGTSVTQSKTGAGLTMSF